jgi:magnesium chelatase family protein
MLTKVRTCAVVGLQGSVVEVEVDISGGGNPNFFIVGLPDTAVQEARERVRSAIRNSGCEFPVKRITVSLAPADLKKEGPAYDLPIAVGILKATGQLSPVEDKSVYLGELALDGSVRHTRGILPMVALARDQGFSPIYVPSMDAKEGALVQGAEVVPVDTLARLVGHLRGEERIQPFKAEDLVAASEEGASMGPDLSDVKGQEHAKRAVEVAAAGGHNLVMTGPPGSGKTLLARTLPSILPTMTTEEALEVTKIYSIAGMLPPDQPLMRQRPFRSPHYSASHVALVGGGKVPRPGEITLSHRGVLFLDELPEFTHIALESLRQPLEDHEVTISRAQGNVTFPCSFMMVAAMNPWPCGYLRNAPLAD